MQWAAAKGLHNLLIELGKPSQNGTNESLNAKFTDECSAMNWFYSRAHARVITEAWPKHYSGGRPHSRLGHKTPMEFMSEWKNRSTNGAGVYTGSWLKKIDRPTF